MHYCLFSELLSPFGESFFLFSLIKDQKYIQRIVALGNFIPNFRSFEQFHHVVFFKKQSRNENTNTTSHFDSVAISIFKNRQQREHYS
jgi:hypothetical protein